MTQEEKDNLKNILFQHKAITYIDYTKEDPFLGIFFNDLVKILEEL